MTRLSNTLPSARPSFDLESTKRLAESAAKQFFTDDHVSGCVYPLGRQRAYWLACYEIHLMELEEENGHH